MNPGIYIHVPFCNSKCGYCDFYSITDFTQVSSFINSLQTEIKYYSEKFQPKETFDTIYIGGGTPSVLSVSDISKLLNELFKRFKFSNDMEITLEINPGTFNKIDLSELKKIGINRISIGVQSFIDEELIFLGRIHSVKDALNCFKMVTNTGFENINIDLIYSLPNQSLINWERNLNQVIKLNPAHISAYNLSIEKETPFFKLMDSGQINLHSEAEETKFFNITHDVLNQAGYVHYEISNYAKSENKFSRHNYKYWKHVPYFGFGPAAHSFWDNQRWSNIKSIKEYILQINKNKEPIEFKEKLSKKDISFEYIFLNLRTYQGVNWIDFEKEFEFSFIKKFGKIINDLQKSNLAILDENSFKLTHKGMILCDEILPAFVEA